MERHGFMPSWRFKCPWFEGEPSRVVVASSTALQPIVQVDGNAAVLLAFFEVDVVTRLVVFIGATVPHPITYTQHGSLPHIVGRAALYDGVGECQGDVRLLLQDSGSRTLRPARSLAEG